MDCKYIKADTVLPYSSALNTSVLSFFDFLLFHVQKKGETVGKNDLKIIIDFFWLFYH